MRVLIALAVFLHCAGCTRYEPVSVHGAGSMRVEVEVYKGPLSVTRDAQVGQLVAVMTDMVRATAEWRNGAMNQFVNLQGALGTECDARARAGAQLPSDPPGCRLPCSVQEYRGGSATSAALDPRDCALLGSAIDSSGDVIGAACYIMSSPTLTKTVGHAVYLPVGTCEANQEFWPHLGAYRLFLDEALAACPPAADGSARDGFGLLQCQGQTIVVAVENLASMMRAAAFRIADANVARVPRDPRVRSALVRLAYIAAEYGNQIEGRIAVLHKQFGEDQVEPRNLPVGDYLRSARPTDFVQLFDWLKAGDADGRVLSVEDRVRMAERLTSDFYWEKVNEVYASGQGDVSMAFIKDDLGNWNLKSFSNDPRELLASYRKVTDAALKAAARLAANAASGGAADSVRKAGEVAALANQLATGEAPGGAATVAGLDVGGLHDRAAARIAGIKFRFDERGRALEEEIATQRVAVDAAVAERDAARNAMGGGADAAATAKLSAAEAGVTAAQDALDRVQRRLVELPNEAIESVRAALGDHLAVIAAMQDGIAASSAPTKP